MVNLFAGTAADDIIDIALLVPTTPGEPWLVDGLGGADVITSIAVDQTPDTLVGGVGADSLTGNAGANRLTGDDGNDTLLGGDERRGVGDALLGGSGSDQLLAGGGDDLLDGGKAADTADGGSGRDTLTGGDGNDLLVGGRGNDEALGGRGVDTMDGGAGRDVLDGQTGNDWLLGGKGADALTGGDGADELVGGRGADVLTGGTGADRFRFDSLKDAGDTITDFVTSRDVIVLDGSAFGLAAGPGGGLDPADFALAADLATGDAATARLLLIGDELFTNASAAAGDAVLLARLTGGVPTDAAVDFVIIP